MLSSVLAAMISYRCSEGLVHRYSGLFVLGLSLRGSLFCAKAAARVHLLSRGSVRGRPNRAEDSLETGCDAIIGVVLKYNDHDVSIQG